MIHSPFRTNQDPPLCILFITFSNLHLKPNVCFSSFQMCLCICLYQAQECALYTVFGMRGRVETDSRSRSQRVVSLVRSLNFQVPRNTWLGVNNRCSHISYYYCNAVLQLVGVVKGSSHIRSLMPPGDDGLAGGGVSEENRQVEKTYFLIPLTHNNLDPFFLKGKL